MTHGTTGHVGKPDDAERRQAKEERRAEKDELRAAGELKGQKARGWTERVLTRTTSGAIYAIAVLACLYLGTVATTLLIAMMAWLCCSEFYRIMRMCGRLPNELIGLAAAAAFPLAAYLGPFYLWIVGFVLLLATAWWYVVALRATISDVAVTVFGPLYTGLLLTGIVLVRKADPTSAGALLTLGVMASIWADDALAYVFGSRFGAHKLAPKISPNKSWEGVVGGLAGSLIIWGIVAFIQVEGVTWPLAVLLALTIGTASVIGDLVESRIKRGAGVKDSGNFMPGHGGLLDRTDSMLFGCMVAFLVLRIGGIV
jgi:phosphatidate cytidylyltransferase